MKLCGTFNNSVFQKSVDYIIKNTLPCEIITLLFTNDQIIFYSEAIYGQLHVCNIQELESRHEFQSNPSIGISLKQSVLHKLSLKMKPFEFFEFVLLKGPKIKFFSHQYSFLCLVELVHPSQYRNEVNVPSALKFKLPDLKQYVDVLSNLGATVTISVAEYLILEQIECGSNLCIKLPIEIVELQLHSDNTFRITVHSNALSKLFKAQVENSVGCINNDFFGIYIQLPNNGWMILCLDTLIEA